LVQAPLALMFLFFCLAWIKEDPFAASKAHKH